MTLNDILESPLLLCLIIPPWAMGATVLAIPTLGLCVLAWECTRNTYRKARFALWKRWNMKMRMGEEAQRKMVRHLHRRREFNGPFSDKEVARFDAAERMAYQTYLAEVAAKQATP